MTLKTKKNKIMAKAKVKEEVAAVEDNSIPSGMKAKDLSLEKRVDMYSKEFEKFKATNAEVFGLMIDVELAHLAKGIFPRMILVDLLKNQQQNEQPQKQG